MANVGLDDGKAVEGYIPLFAASVFSGISTKTIRRAIAAGRLRAFRPSGGSRAMILISRRELIAWIESSVIDEGIGGFAK